jgi:hypothetical protein
MKIGILDPPTDGQSSSFPLERERERKKILQEIQPDMKTKLAFVIY